MEDPDERRPHRLSGGQPGKINPGRENEGAEDGSPISGSLDRSPREALAISLEALPIAGITRRHMGWLFGAVVCLWVIALFVRQVGEASAASARADQMRADNAALAAEVAALDKERTLIQKQQYILQQARGYLLGEPREHPFTLAPAASLGPDAPGSAALRLGAPAPAQSPLESWLARLFGPSP